MNGHSDDSQLWQASPHDGMGCGVYEEQKINAPYW